MARELGMVTAKPSKTSEADAETKENDDNELPSTWEHRMYRAVVGSQESLWPSCCTDTCGSSTTETAGTLHHLHEGRDTANGAHNSRAERGVLG